MKKVALLLLFPFTLLMAQAQQPGAILDVLHYQFSIDVNDENNIIAGEASIDIVLLKASTIVSFELVGKRADGKGMTVKKVLVNNQPASFKHTEDKVQVDLQGQAGSRQTIMIQYEGIPADGLVIANNKYGHRGFFADNWPNRARNWLPCIDHPADKAPVDFVVTAPDHYQVVANGVQLEETSLGNHRKLTHYKETTPLPMKVMVIGVADFAVQYAGNVDCIPVYSWVYPENKEQGFYDYAQATEILPFFIKNVGPYGYGKLANVQSKTMFGGLENAGAIFYSENSVTGTRRSESLLSHEIAHQWFGDMATETEWAHIWLSEGFATYMTILYFENKYGKDTANKMLLKDRLQVTEYAKRRSTPVVDSSVTDYMQLLNTNSYQKGSWVLHMLRNTVGDSAFWKGIRLYYQRYAGRNASTDNLREAMETESGKDLKPFFTQWLFTAGNPVLDISWQYDATKKVVTVTITQQQEALFQFPLELGLRDKQGTTLLTGTVEVNGKSISKSFPVQAAVESLSPDPQLKLLYEARVHKQ